MRKTNGQSQEGEQAIIRARGEGEKREKRKGETQAHTERDGEAKESCKKEKRKWHGQRRGRERLVMKRAFKRTRKGRAQPPTGTERLPRRGG